MTCGSLPVVPFSFPDRTISTGNRYQDTATYTCLPGYRFTGTSTVSCQANRQWSTTPQCVSKYIPANCHLFGVFLLTFGMCDGYTNHSLIITHLPIFHSFLKEMTLILAIFATQFHPYRFGGFEILIVPRDLGSDHFETFWLVVSMHTHKLFNISTYFI